MIHHDSGKKGFSLIELLIAMCIGSIVLVSVFNLLRTQERSHKINQQTIAMNQNARATLFLLERDIMMAGFDPTKFSSPDRSSDGVDNDCSGVDNDEPGDYSASILIASPNKIQFNMDSDSAGLSDQDMCDAGENITFGFKIADDTDDNGIADNGAAPICKKDLYGGGSFISIADNIQAIGFAYAFDANNDGDMDRNGGGNIIWAFDSNNDGDLDMHLDTNDDGQINSNDTEGGAAMASEIDIEFIKVVRVWVLARTNDAVNSYPNKNTYVVGNKWIDSGGDRHFRNLLVSTMKCRNMGL